MGSSRRHQRPTKVSQPTRQRQTRSKGRVTESDPALNNQLITEQLRALGLYAAATLGDGNCLFRALSDQLYGTPSHHLQLRRDVCNWIESHKQRYEPFCEDERGIDTHLSCMRQPGTYGGHMELSAFAHLTHRDVKVIQPGLVYIIEAAGDEPESPSSPMHTDVMDSRERRRQRRERMLTAKEQLSEESDAEDDGPVYVAYHDWEHFSSIRNLRGPHTGLPEVREMPPTEAPPASPRRPKPYAKPKSKTTRKPVSAAGTSTPSHIPLPDSRSPSPTPLTPLRDVSPVRSFRSPKRTFDESSCSSRGDPSDGASDNPAKRSRSAMAVDHDEDTPSLSPPSNLSSPLSSEDESEHPVPTPPPQQPVRAFTRRERKKLGLPKPRAVGASAGKIVIPGGRYKGALRSRTDADVDVEADEDGPAEWQRNGTGRMDVRGFRELKI